MKMQMQIHAEIGPTFGRQALHGVLAMMNNDFDLTLGLEHLNKTLKIFLQTLKVILFSHVPKYVCKLGNHTGLKYVDKSLPKPIRCDLGT